MAEKSPLDQALEILNLEPIPDDAEERLKTLEAQADDTEKELFRQIWEGWHQAQDRDGILAEKR